MMSATPRVVAVVHDRPDAFTRALASDAEWLWFLAEGARPRDDALERLTAAIEPEDAAPATVLAGLLVDDRGDPVDAGVQPAPGIDSAEAVRLVRQRLLPIRSAGFANCLVARAAFSRHGLPNTRKFGPHAPEEWTARVLRKEPGYLVPASVVVLPARAEPADRGAGLSNLLATMRMLPTGTWNRGDAARALWRALTAFDPSRRSASAAWRGGSEGTESCVCWPRPMPRPFRVTYVGHVARFSGAEIGLVRFLAATDEVDATVILAEDGPLVQRLEDAGARVETLPLAERARGLKKEEMRPGRAQVAAGVEVAGYVGRLRARLRQLRPDLVHTHSLKAGVYGGLAARLAGVPVIWHLHDRLAPDYLPKMAVPPMRFLASTLPSALVVPSRHTLATVGRRFRPGLRTAIIPFPVPLPSEACGVRDHVTEIGIVGRLAPWKGQHVFLDAFARAFPDSSVRARIVGSAIFGEKFYEEKLLAQAEALGIEDRVDFVGFALDVEAELRRLDLLVHASVTADPLATVVLEGMAAGLPVVSADDGGHAEHIQNGREGLLFQPGNADALAEALRRAASDRELRVTMSEAGRRKAREFAPDALVKRMLALYRDVAGRRLARG